MRGRTPRWWWIGAGVGTLLAIGGLIAALAWPAIFDSVLASQLVLVPSTRAYRQWMAPSVPIYLDLYMFNWTNADKFPGENPAMEEIGPYRFREHRRHVNVTYHAHNNSLSYRTQRTWFFEESSSNGTMDDNITTLNGIAASAVYKSRYWNFLTQKGLSMFLAAFGQKLYVSKLAKELLFEGYEDALLDLAKSLPASSTGGAPQVDRFGWFYQRNNSIDTDGFMEVSTGELGGTLPGQILRWNYEDHLPFYSGECSKLSGSAGEFLPRTLTQESRLTMFVPDLCRTVNMDYVGSGKLEGLEYHKYAMLERSFDNSSFSSSNTCFCNGKCAWSGVMNVSACRFESPAFLSLPHFLNADESLQKMVTGLNPDPDKHSFYFAVEPKLGVPLEVAGRFQFNMYIEPIPYIALYEKVPKMLFPIFWVEQKVRIDEDIMSELRTVRAVCDWGGAVCAAVTLALVLVLAPLLAAATCCPRKPHYVKADLNTTFEKPQDEAEIKLNPI